MMQTMESFQLPSCNVRNNYILTLSPPTVVVEGFSPPGSGFKLLPCAADQCSDHGSHGPHGITSVALRVRMLLLAARRGILESMGGSGSYGGFIRTYFLVWCFNIFGNRKATPDRLTRTSPSNLLWPIKMAAGSRRIDWQAIPKSGDSSSMTNSMTHSVKVKRRVQNAHGILVPRSGELVSRSTPKARELLVPRSGELVSRPSRNPRELLVPRSGELVSRPSRNPRELPQLVSRSTQNARELLVPRSGELVSRPSRNPRELLLPRSREIVSRSSRNAQELAIPPSELVSREDHWIPLSGPLFPRSEESFAEYQVPQSGPIFPGSGELSASRPGKKVRTNFKAEQKKTRKVSTPRTPPFASLKKGNSSHVQKKEVTDTVWDPLRENWHEVLDVVLSKDFDNLVDLEEFFGYYFLLHSPTYRGLVEQVFKQFCNDFSVPVANLMVPSTVLSYDNRSSEKELECLPPSPCSKQTLTWFNELGRMDKDINEIR